MNITGFFHRRYGQAIGTDARPASPAHSPLRRDPLLIGRLRQERMDAFARLEVIHSLLKSSDDDGARRQLGEFMLALRDQAEHKRTLLYAPLTQRHHADREIMNILNEQQTLLHGLTRAAVTLYGATGHATHSPAGAEVLRFGLEWLRTRMVHCREGEESWIFPLYEEIEITGTGPEREDNPANP